MLSDIDNILFPESCEVIQLASQQFVFPIMKNGSSSFYWQLQNGSRPDWKILNKFDIQNIKVPVMVFLRNPKQRFISGVNTYLQHLHRDYHHELDTKTILWFVDNYLFLNRHYCPQFFWLLHLANHADLLLDLRPMSDIDQYANLNDRAAITPPSDEFLKILDDFNWKKLELYFYLDQILLDNIGKITTFSQLLTEIRKAPQLNDLILNRTIKLFNVLSKN